jgi:hypothetical protein
VAIAIKLITELRYRNAAAFGGVVGGQADALSVPLPTT